MSVSARCPLRESRLCRVVALRGGEGEGKVNSFPETYDSLLLSL